MKGAGVDAWKIGTIMEATGTTYWGLAIGDASMGAAICGDT